MRVGVLTGGGDCPGLNAVIRAVVRKGVQEYGLEFVGFRDGWRGPLEGDTVPLDVQAVRGILPRGGTILGASRTNPLKNSGGGRNGIERIKDNLAGLGVDALIAIGGEDTLGVATRLGEQGVPVVGVPETLDSFGHVRLGGVGQMLADEIEKRTGKEARCTVLGHIQRGGTPTAFDRVLATRFGVHAVQAVHDEAFGVMVALRGTDIIRVPLVEATSQLKLVPPQRYAEAEVFFG